MPKAPKLPQTSEPPDITFGLTIHELDDNLKIKIWDNVSYMKYKVHNEGNVGMEMRSIYIRPPYREMKNGTRMMEWIEAEAKRQGQDNVWVHATTDGKTDILGVFLKRLKYKDEGEFIWRKSL